MKSIKSRFLHIGDALKYTIIQYTLVFSALFIGLQSCTSNANANIISVGDLIVSDYSLGAIYKIDPATGAQTLLASGGLLQHPHGIAIEDAGTIIVAERSTQSILRIDLVTGNQTVLSSGGSFVNFIDVELEPDGNILVTDAGANAIFRIDPITGVGVDSNIRRPY